MSYVIIALGLGLLSLVEILFEKKFVSMSLMTAICVFLIFINGARTWGGDDLYVYQNYYQDLSLAKIKYGFGFEALTNVSNKLGLTFEEFIFGIAFFIIPVQLAFFIKSTGLPVTATFIFYVMGFIWIDQILIRQSLASCFVLIGIMLYLSGRRFTSVGSIITAGLFHASAIVVYVTWLLLYKFKKYSYFIAILVLAAGLFILNTYNIFSQYEDYISPNIQNYIENGEGLAFSRVTDFIIALFLYIVAQNKFTENEKKFYNLVFLNSAIFLVISFNLNATARILDYAIFFYAIVFSKFIYGMPLKLKLITFLFFYIYGITRIYYFTLYFDNGVLMNYLFKI